MNAPLRLTQKELADQLGVNPSTISRGLFGKSVVTPWGEERPLEFFMINRKKMCETALRKIYTDKTMYALSDEALRKILKNQYHLSVARRTVAYYRSTISQKRSGARSGISK